MPVFIHVLTFDNCRDTFLYIVHLFVTYMGEPVTLYTWLNR